MPSISREKSINVTKKKVASFFANNPYSEIQLVDTHGQSPWHFTGQANLDLNAGIPADCSLF